ncbi:uncharacterized protein LOC105796645 [Gossypium raimondii]|uniref:uncharacterized protein LOC105796645 n=1 Tax=Gossypium raimondii TaxID=29730 RepID=UPI00227CAFBF|nr:uncharacterized protein LOC105796645 [Gossypium raimondii]
MSCTSHCPRKERGKWTRSDSREIPLTKNPIHRHQKEKGKLSRTKAGDLRIGRVQGYFDLESMRHWASLYFFGWFRRGIGYQLTSAWPMRHWVSTIASNYPMRHWVPFWCVWLDPCIRQSPSFVNRVDRSQRSRFSIQTNPDFSITLVMYIFLWVLKLPARKQRKF